MTSENNIIDRLILDLYNLSPHF